MSTPIFKSPSKPLLDEVDVLILNPVLKLYLSFKDNFMLNGVNLASSVLKNDYPKRQIMRLQTVGRYETA